MEPILNQKEISELLQAIRDGKVPLDPDGGEESFLDCTPINLFQMARPDREQFRIPNFDIIIDAFCRHYATSLTNQLQKTFSIKRVGLETYEFQKFMAKKNAPGAIGIFELPPLKQGALMIFNPKLSFAMLEIMLGASSDIETLELERQLTTIELNILKTPMGEACVDINKAFEQLLDINTDLLKLENNPRLVSIVEPEGEVIVSTLQVKVGTYSGEIDLIFPFATLEPLREPLKELLSIATTTKGSWHAIIEDHLQNLPITLIAQSGTIEMKVEEVLGLQVGDVIGIDYDPNAPLQVIVEDSPKFYAIPGTHNGKKAISLTGSF